MHPQTYMYTAIFFLILINLFSYNLWMEIPHLHYNYNPVNPDVHDFFTWNTNCVKLNAC